MAKGIFNGRFVKINYSSLPLTDELLEAMEALDADCAHGCGGTWDIFSEDQDGVPFRAVFADFASDELVWNSEAGSWTDGYDEDEEDDEDDDDAVWTLVG